MNRISAHLLVVDDDPVTLALLNEVLSKEGYEVETVTDGAAAIRRGTAWERLPHRRGASLACGGNQKGRFLDFRISTHS
jgi:CheY-like chemotaxis protein